jgi:murein endopeptidase
MSIPIQSKSFPEFFRMPAKFGIQIASWRLAAHRDWGKKHTIDYLLRLTDRWVFDTLLATRVGAPRYAPILLGDIAPEGGAKSADPVSDHKSHKSGVDLDLFIFRKDLAPATTDIGRRNEYDFDLTLKLALAVYRVGNPTEIERVFFDDRDVIRELHGKGFKTIGPDPGRIDPVTKEMIAPPTPHRDHLHVRLRRTPPAGR